MSDAANVVFAEGDYERAQMLAEESVEVYRTLGDAAGLAFALQLLGLLAGYRGDFTASRHWLDESLALYQEVRNDWGIGLVRLNLGKVARIDGKREEARAFHEQALPALLQGLNAARAAEALIDLSGLAQEQGDAEHAAALAAECLRMLHDRGITMYLPEGVELLAGVALTRGQAARAARLFGAADASRMEIGARRQPGHAALHARQIAAVRAKLGDAAFAAAFAAGQKLELGEVVTDSLAQEERIANADSRVGPGAAQPPNPLTPREREVVGLIARGLTDRQIAEELVITTGTAGNHVVHILAKLGFRSRTQVAAWAVEHGAAPGTPGLTEKI
jgi:DNA-binding NarL/FixJ family response regulator